MPRRSDRLHLFILAGFVMLSTSAFAPLASIAQTEDVPLIKPAGKEATLLVGGLLQAQGEFGDRGDARFATKNDRFYLRRARLNFGGQFLEDYAFRVEMDLAGSLGETSGLRAQVTDGYVSWNLHPEFTIRGGQFKSPYGYEQLLPDPKVSTVERSLPNDRLTLGRQIGVMAAGELYEKRVTWAAGLFNGTGVNNSFNDGENFLYAGRVSGVPWQAEAGANRWSVGIDGYASSDAAVSGQAPEFGFDSTPGGTADNIFSGKRSGFGVDTQLHAGAFDFWFEYLRVNFEPVSHASFRQFDSDGFYAQAAWMFVPAWLQGLVRYELFHPFSEYGDNRTEILTVGLTSFIKGEDLKFVLNHMHTMPSVLEGSAPPDSDKLLARMQVVF